MRTITYIVLTVFCLAMFASGCGSGPSAQDKIIVTVANKSITLKDFKQRLSKLPSFYKGTAEKNKKALLDDMIVESLFLEDAVRKGLDRDKEVREILEEAKKKIIVAKFVKTEIEDKIKVSEPEMRKLYEEHKEDFKKPAMWRASQILLANENEAKSVLDELAKGKSFEDLAKAKSIDATAARGGDVGYFRKGQVIPEFENSCFNLKVGELSGIVHTQFGYHIIKLTDKKNEEIESFDEAKNMIENMLRVKKRSELFEKTVLQLKNQYRVRIEDDAMKSIETLTPEKKSPENK